jgi:hypothetical protein
MTAFDEHEEATKSIPEIAKRASSNDPVSLTT